MLLNELWVVILSFSSLIGIINFRCVCSKFFQISKLDKRYNDKKKYVDSTISFDDWFDFLTKMFDQISVNFRLIFKKTYR